MCKWNQLIIPRFNYNGFIVIARSTTACNGQLRKAHMCNSPVHPLYRNTSLWSLRASRRQEYSKGTKSSRTYSSNFVGVFLQCEIHASFMTEILLVNLYENISLLSYLPYHLTGAFQKTVSQVTLAQFLVGLPRFRRAFGEVWRSRFQWERSRSGAFYSADLIRFYFLLYSQQNPRLLWITHEVCLV